MEDDVMEPDGLQAREGDVDGAGPWVIGFGTPSKPVVEIASAYRPKVHGSWKPLGSVRKQRP